MTLTTKLAVAMIALVAISVSAVGWLNYRSVEQVVIPRVLDRIESQARLVADYLESYVAGARGDVASLRSGVAVTALMRARQTGGSADGISEAAWRERLASRLSDELAAKPAYAGIRVIGLDDGGREIVRVERSGANGAIRIVPDAELGPRADRSYFKETLKLRPGEKYVSRLNLDRIDWAVLIPHRPTLRVAAPLFAPNGKLFGVFL